MNLRVIVTGVISLLGSSVGTKVITLAVIAVATRQLGLEAVGLVFFVEAAASISLRFADLGFYEVLVRRAARGQATRRTIARALVFRTAVLAIGCVAAGVVAGVSGTDQALVATGFFGVFGVFFLHEIGRAILAGKEMFGRNAAIALASRGLGSSLAVLGMLGGYGIEAWLVGMALAEVMQLLWVTAVAWRSLPEATDQVERPLYKEGLPFWALALLKVSVNHGAMLIVGGLLGLSENGIFGVATKAIQGSLLGVVGLTYAAYPTLARDRRKVIERLHGVVVLVVAALVSAAVLVGAPFLARLLGEGDEAQTTEVIRWLTFAAFIMSVAQPLDAWVRAKDGERGLVSVAVIEGVVTLGSMIVLVQLYDLMGAVVAVTVGALVRLLGTAALARIQIRDFTPREAQPPDESVD